MKVEQEIGLSKLLVVESIGKGTDGKVRGTLAVQAYTGFHYLYLSHRGIGFNVDKGNMPVRVRHLSQHTLKLLRPQALEHPCKRVMRGDTARKL